MPTNGPFGPTAPAEGPWLDVALDAVVIIVVANGLRLGRRWAWVLSVVWAILNVLVAVLYLALSPLDPVDLPIDWGDTDVFLATSVLWLAFLVYLLATRSSFVVATGAGSSASGGSSSRTLPSADDARRSSGPYGGGSLSWMATWEGMEYFRTSVGLVPYQKHVGVAIVLADPLGHRSTARRASRSSSRRPSATP